MFFAFFIAFSDILLYLLSFIKISLIFTTKSLSFSKAKTVIVPSVKGLTVSKAEEKLEDAGLVVNSRIKKVTDKKVKKGRVVKTDPSKGRKVKKGTKVTIYKSSGEKTYKIKDYTGKNYIEVQTILESKYGLKVTIEKKDVTDSDKDEQEIIGQSLAKGSEVKKGDKITLYIPNLVVTFPDMVSEGYTVDEAEAFCKKYNLTLKTNLVETTSAAAGKIIAQSRKAGSEIVEGTNLTVDVAATPTNKNEPSTSKEIKGCTAPDYEEYNSKATKDDGSCKTKKSE